MLLVSTVILGQEILPDAKPVKQHEFGMNMTGLVNQVVPFKQLSDRTGPYSVTYKRISGNRAFRAGLGMHFISEDFFSGDLDVFNFNLRMGMEIRRPVNEKINFYQTFDLMGMAGNFNSPINDFDGTDQVGVGIGLGLGIEYFIYDNLSLSTEGIGFAGIVGGSGTILTVTVIPPIAIFLNYKF
jgi:hypothetical protein